MAYLKMVSIGGKRREEGRAKVAVHKHSQPLQDGPIKSDAKFHGHFPFYFCGSIYIIL